MDQPARYATDVTIVIPTMNRAQFLETYVRALTATGYAGTLLICDSSEESEYARAQRLLADTDATFPIIHHHLPGLGNAQAVNAALADVKTPYAIYMPDDDILVPRTLEAAARFLDDAPDYGAATGHAVIVPIEKGRVSNAAAYNLRAFNQEGPAARLESLFSDYCVVHFALSRAEHFRRCWRAGAQISERYFSGELVINCLHLIYGKVGLVDGLLVVRQDHAARVSQNDFFEWITREGWSEGVRRFLDTISGELAIQGPLSDEAARAAIKQGFWLYLAKHLSHSYGAQYKINHRAGLRSRLRQIHWLWLLVRFIRSRYPGDASHFALEALLRPNSRFHSDFMPVYNALSSNGPARPTS
jgi:glycosyltransferase domain-containing protein